MEEQVKNTVLDLAKASADEATAIVRGFNKFCDENNTATKYFGYVDKDGLEYLNRAFKYTDKLSFAKGAAAGLSVAGLVAGVIAAVKEK